MAWQTILDGTFASVIRSYECDSPTVGILVGSVVSTNAVCRALASVSLLLVVSQAFIEGRYIPILFYTGYRGESRTQNAPLE